MHNQTNGVEFHTMMTSDPPKIIESARLSMLEARKTLEDYEARKGYSSSTEHTRLTHEFSRAAQLYLKLSQNQF